MSWLILIFILISYYFLFVYVNLPEIAKPSGPEPQPEPFHFKFKFQNGKIRFYNSLGQKWEFIIDDAYYFSDGKIQIKNICFGKLDGTKVKAVGKDLYEYIQKEKLKNIQNGQFQVNVNEAVQKSHVFYFNCANNQIEGLYTCPSNQIFDDTQCVSVNPCTNRPKGTKLADEFDRRFYYECPHDRVKCPDKSFFVYDSCRSESDLTNVCANNQSYILPISNTEFLKCVSGIPKVYKCPPGMFFSNDKCVSDVCFNKPDGSKIAFSEENFGPFRYSSGYYVCKNDRVYESVQCPNDWDRYDSKGDNLVFLPQVFDNGKCTIPEFCVNVTTDDPEVVVPSHNFTKNVKNWMNSLLFDGSVGYRCNQNQKEKLIPPPGQYIYDYRLHSGCDAPGKKVVLGENLQNYYDCDQKTIIPCPQNTFFDGTDCKTKNQNAHSYGEIDMFEFDNLENNWMVPWDYSGEQRVTCSAPENFYIAGYNVCSHPDCRLFPFLKQLKGRIQIDSWNKCVYEKGKISKVKTATRDHFDFWTQRRSLKPEKCIVGSRIKSGHFMLDSVLYATCESEQPFVFCPSSATDGIKQINKFFACNPNPSVFEGILKANITKQFLENHLSRIIPKTGARVTINGNLMPNTDPNGIAIGEDSVEIWSNEDIRLIYKIVINHPANTYFEDKTLKSYNYLENLFITRYKMGLSMKPLDFPYYDIKESVHGFRSDAT
ncbi:hypothetical protein AVEN_149172-1 [Araneus ventricosus]|uniref:Chitin-binding type-2 domain-containing protein n=1 Tax=Araneus ventricosus TaxID=182803 RepID=A0A4Y2TC94_ARAVE|nr:hypothetical protein AVEN_149172-1 [Araneus ventricosus]